MMAVAAKRRLRTLEPRLQQVLQVTVPHDLDRLQCHRDAIELSQRSGDWETLRKEQRHATLTIKDLKTHVELLEDLREEVRDEDMDQFDRMVEPTRMRVVRSVESFLQIDPAITITTEDVSADELQDGPSDHYELVNTVSSENTAASWRQMEQELRELKEMTNILKQQTSTQSTKTECIEQNVATAQTNTSAAHHTLMRSLSIKSAIMPVGGAIVGGVIGGVVGGPIGAFAGLKIGAMAAVAGTTAGAVGGGWLGYKRQQSRAQNIEQDKKDS